MTLPSFNEFLLSIDHEKMDYDLSLYCTSDMKDNYNPFDVEQYKLLVKTNIAITKAFLAQYHQWLSEKLHE